LDATFSLVEEQKFKGIFSGLFFRTIYIYSGESFLKKAVMAQQGNNLEVVIENYLLFIQKHPEYYQAYFNLAYVYLNQKKYRAAIYYFKKTLEVEPRFVEAYKYLASCYNLLGDKEKAQKYKVLYGKV
ncbi:tetratricopeptide repeat protein, partial [bacterium]